MKKYMVLTVLSLFAAISAHADAVTLSNKDSQAVVSALRAAKVQSTGGEDSLSIKSRALVCDDNSGEVKPNQSSCTIVPDARFGAPIVVVGKAAHDLYNALAGGIFSANPNGEICDSGFCSLQLSSLDCEGNSAKPVSCIIF